MIPEGPSGEGLDAVAQLAARRTLFLRGPLDVGAANELVAQLMALDAVSGDPVTVVVNSPGGPLDDLFTVLDVAQVIGARVDVTCLGQALGTAGVLVACAPGHRRATPSARLSLRLAPGGPVTGDADGLTRLADLHEARLADVARRLADATALDVATAAAELRSGGTYDAAGARAAGLVDEVQARGR